MSFDPAASAAPIDPTATAAWGELTALEADFTPDLRGWFAADPARRPLLFWLILVFSVIFAHAPASFRHRRLR